MTEGLLDIGEVVAAAGVPLSTLHLWERRGLIEPAGRRGLRRQYQPDILTTLAIIVLCQRTGFTLGEIGQLLTGPAAADKELLTDKLAQLTEQRRRLDQAILGIEHALACSHPRTTECPGFRKHLDNVLPANRGVDRTAH